MAMVKTSLNKISERKLRHRIQIADPDQQWYFSAKKSPRVCTDAGINIAGAWNITKGHPDVTVSIVDVEFDVHSTTASPSKFISSHGSGCSAFAIGEYGVAPGCSFLPVTISRQPADDLIIQILER